jgi:hypothetical protein
MKTNTGGRPRPDNQPLQRTGRASRSLMIGEVVVARPAAERRSVIRLMLPLPQCRPLADAGWLSDAQWFIEHSPREWVHRLNLERRDLVLAAIAAVDWLLPLWQTGRPSDSAPVRAVDVARSHPIAPTENLRMHARALAKACTASRERSMGYEHRIAEAARAVALASAATSDAGTADSVAEAFAKVEEHALYAFAVVGTYGIERAVREEMLNRIKPVVAAAAGG